MAACEKGGKGEGARDERLDPRHRQRMTWLPFPAAGTARSTSGSRAGKFYAVPLETRECYSFEIHAQYQRPFDGIQWSVLTLISAGWASDAILILLLALSECRYLV
jgi:hypothetical protein